MDPRTPVLIGGGQLTNRVDEGAPESEPVDLMVRALTAAGDSAGSEAAPRELEWIGVVPVISWRYYDAARLVAERLGANRARTAGASIGGHTPVLLLNHAARAIQAGDLDLAAVVGGEAYRTRVRHRRADGRPPWTDQDPAVAPDEIVGSDSTEMFHPAEAAQGLLMPTQMYPLFENALRSRAGRTIAEHQEWMSTWWARFSEVAKRNPYAWRRTAYSPEEVRTVTPENRWVGFPYTKRMVSNPDVDMAAGVIVASAAKADALGVPRDRWVFLHSGTDGVDRLPSVRHDFAGSASIRVAGRRALELAGISVDDLAHVDLYSCFPSAVELGANELGLDYDRELTVYGGLCFAGGPWNNPTSHALAAMIDVIRESGAGPALVTANGGIVGKHGFVVLSPDPSADGFRWDHPQAEIDAEGEVPVVEDHEGPVTIETYAVMYERDGTAASCHAACRTPDDSRVWARSTDTELMAAMVTEEFCGRPGEVRDGILHPGET